MRRLPAVASNYRFSKPKATRGEIANSATNIIQHSSSQQLSICRGSQLPEYENPLFLIRRKPALLSVRKTIKSITAATAALSWLLTVLIFLSFTRPITFDAEALALKSLSLLIAVVQATLVLAYWKQTTRHEFLTAAAFGRDNAMSVVREKRSKKVMALCVVECALHLAVPLYEEQYAAEYSIYGMDFRISLNSFLLVLVALRNYNTLRFLYWSSHLSGQKQRFFSRLCRVESLMSYTLRCYLAEYAVPLVLEVFALMLVVSGVVSYAFDHYSAAVKSNWDHFWLVTYTQTTIGYGDAIPHTFLGQVTAVFSCFFGPLLLGLINAYAQHSCAMSPRENDMYYHLTRVDRARKNKKTVVVLIQRWWRVLRMRIKKTPKGELVMKLMVQMAKFRKLVQMTHDHQSLRLAKQVQVTALRLRRRFIAVKDHLRPTYLPETLVPITQSEHFLMLHIHTRSKCTLLESSAAHAANFHYLISDMCRLAPKSDRGRLRSGSIALSRVKNIAYLNAMRYSVRHSVSRPGDHGTGNLVKSDSVV